jgi:HAD superfamily hydrolase (TIGR01509 family)
MFQREGLRAVIFDIDGTLVDSFSVYLKVFNEGIADYDIGPVAQDFLDNCLRNGKSLREILKVVFPLNTDDSTIDMCQDSIKRLFRQVEPEEVRSFPGVEELFRSLKSWGVKIGIATGRVSTPEDEWRRFARLGLSNFIDAIVTSQEVLSRKPAPDVLLECARRLHVPIGACLAVGDTESDVLAAKRAGATAAYVRTGAEDADAIAKAGPDIILENTYDLLAVLKGA